MRFTRVRTVSLTWACLPGFYDPGPSLAIFDALVSETPTPLLGIHNGDRAAPGYNPLIAGGNGERYVVSRSTVCTHSDQPSYGQRCAALMRATKYVQ